MSTLLACGAEQDVTTASSTTQSGVAASGPQSAEQPATSPPVVPGRKPVSTSTSSAVASDDSDTTCGTIPGPDGSLRVLVLAGDVACDSATSIATQYGPKIASGQQQSVGGWTCAPSQLEGVLAACQKGTAVIGFAP
ncbi:hypothetical protein CA982_01120 [Gordonia lacunae]|uniref:Uncharacterized protein n=1 Tax=Gordonia lacunae TaxID=417102 RepID=A0A2C9ZJS2_9ACTN|nr:hypothetical protein [Gordonia lacunae]OUC80982.1 hypothetical protein CA982_01120 [Gordonia lacunae]